MMIRSRHHVTMNNSLKCKCDGSWQMTSVKLSLRSQSHIDKHGPERLLSSWHLTIMTSHVTQIQSIYTHTHKTSRAVRSRYDSEMIQERNVAGTFSVLLQFIWHNSNELLVFSKGRNAVGPSKSLIFWTFSEVLDFFWPFNMGDFSFWYFWVIWLKKNVEKYHSPKRLNFRVGSNWHIFWFLIFWGFVHNILEKHGRKRFLNFFFNHMSQKYQNEKSPILNGQKKPKT